MLLELQREKKTELSNLGPLKVDGSFECYFLENAKLAIPAGTYALELYDSPKHGPDTPQLKNVPGRSNIQIHIANFPHELLGCIAPGTSMGDDCVNHSGAACKVLLPKIVAALKAGETVKLSIQ